MKEITDARDVLKVMAKRGLVNWQGNSINLVTVTVIAVLFYLTILQINSFAEELSKPSIGQTDEGAGSKEPAVVLMPGDGSSDFVMTLKHREGTRTRVPGLAVAVSKYDDDIELSRITFIYHCTTTLYPRCALFFSDELEHHIPVIFLNEKMEKITNPLTIMSHISRVYTVEEYRELYAIFEQGKPQGRDYGQDVIYYTDQNVPPIFAEVDHWIIRSN